MCRFFVEFGGVFFSFYGSQNAVRYDKLCLANCLHPLDNLLRRYAERFEELLRIVAVVEFLFKSKIDYLHIRRTVVRRNFFAETARPQNRFLRYDSQGRNVSIRVA